MVIININIDMLITQVLHHNVRNGLNYYIMVANSATTAANA